MGSAISRYHGLADVPLPFLTMTKLEVPIPIVSLLPLGKLAIHAAAEVPAEQKPTGSGSVVWPTAETAKAIRNAEEAIAIFIFW